MDASSVEHVLKYNGKLNIYHLSALSDYLYWLQNYIKLENIKTFDSSKKTRNFNVLCYILGRDTVEKNNGCKYSKLIAVAKSIVDRWIDECDWTQM